MNGRFLLLFVLTGVLGVSVAAISPNADRPALLREVGIDQRLNNQVPLDLPFREETGKPVRLRDYFGSKPVVLALVYYQCPMLCTMALNGQLRAMRALSFNAGDQYEALAVSINPLETPALAAEKKKNFIQKYGRPGAENGWHFLTGEESSIRQLADAAGFHYAYDPKNKLYVHASGIIVLTPEGRMARYFYGLEYSARDLRLGLVEASAGKIGSPVDQVLLFCFHYDPEAGKYGALVLRLVRAGGVATVLALGMFLFVMFRRDRRRRSGYVL